MPALSEGPLGTRPGRLLDHRRVFSFCIWVTAASLVVVVLRNTQAVTVVALALAAGTAAWLVPPQVSESRGIGYKTIGVLLGISALLFLFVLIAGNRQFGGYDYSIPIDLAWRQSQGQHVYRDFPCPYPPAYYLIAWYAFAVLGPSWHIFVVLGASACGVLFFLTGLVLCRLGQPLFRAVLLAGCAQCMTIALCAFFAHNAITSAAGILYVFVAMWLLRSPGAWKCWLSYLLSLVALAGLKPGVAGVLILSVTAILLSDKKTARTTAILSAGAFALYEAVLAVNGISMLDVLRAYRDMSVRGLPSFLYLSHGDGEIAAAMVLFILVLGISTFRSMAAGKRHVSRESMLLGAAALAGTYGIATDAEAVFVDLALIVVVFCYFVMSYERDAEPRRRDEGAISPHVGVNNVRAVAALCGFCLVMGLGLGWERSKVAGIGPFFERAPLREVTSVPFFESLKAGPWFQRILQQMQSIVAANPGRKFFFGTRLEFGYAAFGKPSPRGLPVWWHPGTSYPLRSEGAIVRRFQESKFDVLIFARNDFTRTPAGIVAVMSTEYTRDDRYPDLTVFWRVSAAGHDTKTERGSGRGSSPLAPAEGQ